LAEHLAAGVMMKDEFATESGGLRTETWRAIHCRFTSETSVAHHRLRVIQNGAHMNAELEPCAREALLGKLERALIDDYLDARGYDPVKLAGLPELERAKLLAEASVYASGKLVEVEARSHFLDEMHGGLPGIPKDRL